MSEYFEVVRVLREWHNISHVYIASDSADAIDEALRAYGEEFHLYYVPHSTRRARGWDDDPKVCVCVCVRAACMRMRVPCMPYFVVSFSNLWPLVAGGKRTRTLATWRNFACGHIHLRPSSVSCWYRHLESMSIDRRAEESKRRRVLTRVLVKQNSCIVMHMQNVRAAIIKCKYVI